MADLRLVLFFTRGVSLRTWDQVGMFEREVAIYQRLQEHGVRVAFITYGDASDLCYADRIPGIRILCNRWRLPWRFYEYWLWLLHGFHLWRADIYKTNQTKGADVALRAARFWHKPLIARCGYMWSDLAAHSESNSIAEVHQARLIESQVFNGAEKVVVTTHEMQNYVNMNYGLSSEKVSVIPNYVLTDLFKPEGNQKVPNQLCYVGRLSKEKNLISLVNACAGLDVRLEMIGSGPLREEILELAACLGVELKLHGNLPHSDLPKIMRQSIAFILVSLHEGHPKTLLEAMACRLPVIGADSPGIRELIRHGDTGYICGTDPGSIRAAIKDVLARPQLRIKLGRNARRYVVEHYSLDRVVDMELELIRQLVGR